MHPAVRTSPESPVLSPLVGAPCIARPRRPSAGRRVRFVLVTGLLGLSVSCGGGDSGPTTEPPPPTPGTLAVVVAPSSGSAVAGGSTSATVTITRGGSFSGPVTLSATGLPSGVTASFDPSTVAAGSSTSTLTLQASTGTVPATVPVGVQASGAGVTAASSTFSLTIAPAPSIALTLAPAAVTITQAQQSAALPIVITRQGVAGNVQFALEDAPTGVSGAFAPNPATGASSQLVVSVAAQVAPGTYPLTVRGTIGSVSGTAALSLTVTAASAGDFALAVVPAALTVTAGQFSNTTVNIARSGGFTGAVDLTVTGLPNGVTANFVPASATGNQAQLSIIAAASASPGTFTAVVRGNATLLTERTVNLAVTVQSGGGGGSGNVVWKFCDTRRFPLWFAYKDGANGTWTRVTPGADQTYAFTVNDDVGGVAYVQTQTDVLASTIVLLHSRRELQALGQSECISNPSRKTVNGSVAGLGAGQGAGVALGSVSAQVAFPNSAFTINNVNDVQTDLIAVRADIDAMTAATTPNRFLLRRNVNPADGSTLPVIDFSGGEAFAPAVAQYSVANAGTDQLSAAMGFFTSNGAAGFFGFNVPLASGTSRTIYGIPLARTQSGDLHQVSVSAVGAGFTTSRFVAQYNRELIDRTLTLGPAVNPVQIGFQHGAYVRFRAVGTWQTEYEDGIGVGYTQLTDGGRIWSMQVSRSYLGASSTTFQVDLPDFSAVAGFDNAWGLLPGRLTQWVYSATDISDDGVGPAAEGYFLRTGSRTGTITP